jgi:hypothetical protein
VRTWGDPPIGQTGAWLSWRENPKPPARHLHDDERMERIHACQTPVKASDVVYRAEIWGAQRHDGRWEGWLRFIPPDGRGILSTSRETTQPNRQALIYWATGLEPVYLEGAFERAGGGRTPAT